MGIDFARYQTIRNTVLLYLALGLMTATTFAATESSGGYCDQLSLPKKACSAYEGFQTDADIVRLQHLYYWTNLIYTYKKETGKFPFEGESKHPLYVEIATPQQQQFLSPPPPPAVQRSMTEFVQKLATLEPTDQIHELYDPQYMPDAKPNFYIYMIDGDTFYLAVHTHRRYPFSKRIGPDYYKVEVSNEENLGVNLVLKPDTLFLSQAYQEVVKTPLQNPEFFAQRQELTKQVSQQESK